MQAIAQTYAPDSSKGKTLQEFIIYFGILQLILSQLPNLHSLRFVNFIATFCTLGFTLIATGLSVHDGEYSNLWLETLGPVMVLTTSIHFIETSWSGLDIGKACMAVLLSPISKQDLQKPSQEKRRNARRIQWVGAACTAGSVSELLRQAHLLQSNPPFLHNTAFFASLSLSLADTAGKNSDRSTVSYDLVGTEAYKSFSILAALGTIAFSFGDVGLLVHPCQSLYSSLILGSSFPKTSFI